jgi:hypothetical protein
MAKTAPYLVGDKWTIDKDPEDKLWYVANIAAQLTDSATTATSFDLEPVGVTVLEKGVMQGTSNSLLPVKLGGMGAVGAPSYCTFRVTCANGEQFDRTIWFNRVDN